jgi:TATA-binding protein-associated factor
MPSHTPASALIKLFSIGGAPWEWQAWKDRTGIRHGLFPKDDDFLPPGLTREDVTDVCSYFNAYQALKTEDDKITFATKTRGAPAYPGRKTWNLFVQKNWNRWGIHTAIIEELKDWDIHPYDIVLREGLQSGWPSSDTYISMILDTLGMRLFGEDGFIEGTVMYIWKDPGRSLSIVKCRQQRTP